jgi:hypothetical protein
MFPRTRYHSFARNSACTIYPATYCRGEEGDDIEWVHEILRITSAVEWNLITVPRIFCIYDLGSNLQQNIIRKRIQKMNGKERRIKKGEQQRN